MVSEEGQLYTMEGVAAGIIMLLAAYIAVSTTGIYTTGDTHIPDMQLEQLGSDVLAMMDTPDTNGAESQLVGFVRKGTGIGGGGDLRDAFLNTCRMRAGDPDNSLHAQVFLSYRRADGSVNTTELSSPSDPGFTGRENTVRVTRWVQLDAKPANVPADMRTGAQAVLVEVLLWRA